MGGGSGGMLPLIHAKKRRGPAIKIRKGRSSVIAISITLAWYVSFRLFKKIRLRRQTRNRTKKRPKGGGHGGSTLPRNDECDEANDECNEAIIEGSETSEQFSKAAIAAATVAAVTVIAAAFFVGFRLLKKRRRAGETHEGPQATPPPGARRRSPAVVEHEPGLKWLLTLKSPGHPAHGDDLQRPKILRASSLSIPRPPGAWRRSSASQDPKS
ncbi:uncharacterized protein LOC109716378 [Ananas comosus]|uniref:Uncharacterized protein LOC109716378 n=1 Tax=Ananas comosus TaxID=4615 RepID=A0A6P5FNX4_ANACO|nr:uncharacterized protein LOC109716378 [Ananas comosus]